MKQINPELCSRYCRASTARLTLLRMAHPVQSLEYSLPLHLWHVSKRQDMVQKAVMTSRTSTKGVYGKRPLPRIVREVFFGKYTLHIPYPTNILLWLSDMLIWQEKKQERVRVYVWSSWAVVTYVFPIALNTVAKDRGGKFSHLMQKGTKTHNNDIWMQGNW